jgi:HAD superfamily hydrolase (TIGR01509 family)
VIKAVIFDCFGVVRVDATLIAYKTLGGDISADDNFLKDVMEQANAGLIPNASSVVAQHLGISEEKWRETVQNSSVIDQQLLDFAKSLRSKYKTAMLSNIGQGGLDRWFEPGFLDNYFDVVIGSGNIGFAKPEAQAYEITADRLGVRLDECVMIDDRQELCEGATAVGMQAIRYEDFEQMKKALENILVAGADN